MSQSELTARAFEIADQCMVALLQSSAMRIDEHGVTWAVVDHDGNGVDCLDEADEGLVEAIEWLTKRGLAQVVDSPDGFVVVLTEGVELCQI